MSNPVKDFTKKEWSLWLGSLLIVVVSNLFSGDVDLPTLVAALVGVTSLIFAAKGNVWAQILRWCSASSTASSPGGSATGVR